MIKHNPAWIQAKSPLYFGLFCLFLLLIGCREANTPAEVTRIFWDALIANDIEMAQDYATQTSKQQVNKDLDLNLQDASLKIGEIRINDQQASVQTIFIYPLQKESEMESEDHKPNLNINTYLLKENGIWKVDYQKTTRMLPGKAFNDLMQSLHNLTRSFKEKLEEQAPLIEEKIESLNEQLIKEIDELNQQLEKPEPVDKQSPSTKSI